VISVFPNTHLACGIGQEAALGRFWCRRS